MPVDTLHFKGIQNEVIREGTSSYQHIFVHYGFCLLATWTKYYC